MNKQSSDFLKKILETPSPTGMEIEAQRIWAKYIAPYTDTQECDAYGSTWATLRSKQEGAPTLMLDAHADEIGFSIRHITDDGFAYVERLGGSDVAIARGRRLRFFGKKGEVIGVIGNTAIHIRDDEGKAPKLWELYVDFGCRNREEVEALGLRVGDRAVYCDGRSSSTTAPAWCAVRWMTASAASSLLRRRAPSRSAGFPRRGISSLPTLCRRRWAA